MEYACVVLVSWDMNPVLDSSFLLTLTNLGHGSIRDSVIDVTIVLSLSLSVSIDQHMPDTYNFKGICSV